MENALQVVNEMTVREAAAQFGVPKSTLHDRISEKVQPGSVYGPLRYLDEEKEEELVRWIEGCAQIGYAKIVREIRAIFEAIVAKKNALDSMVVKSRLVGSFPTASPSPYPPKWRRACILSRS